MSGEREFGHLARRGVLTLSNALARLARLLDRASAAVLDLLPEVNLGE